MKVKFFLILVLSVVSFGLSAQETGAIAGLLSDKEFGNEPLVFANVLIKGTSKGTTTDFDGKYLLDQLAPGIYTVQFSYVGYQTVEIETTTEAGKTNSIDVILEANSVSLNEVIVKTSVSRETESALLLQQQKAVVMETAIGAQELTKKGVSDVATAVTKTAGVSKQNNTKGIFVRGLGDRYNITTLNGLPLPSNNPELKNIELGLFSTDIVENIGISKTFSSKNYADFGGGNININSKNFRGQPYVSLGLSLGGNSNVVGKNPFYISDGPSPFGFYAASEPAIPTLTSDWGSSWDRKETDFLLNGGIKLNGGKSFEIGEGRLNTFITLSFDNNTLYREGLSRGKVGADGYTRQNFYKNAFQYNTNTTAMGSFNYRINTNNKLTFTSLFINSSSQNHDEYSGFDIEFDNAVTDNDDGFGFIQRNTFKQTKLFVNQLSGSHDLLKNHSVNWVIGFNQLKSNIPDRMQNTAGRDFRSNRKSDYVLISGSPIYNHRFYQNLSEDEIAVTIFNKWTLRDKEDEVKGVFDFGFSGRYKFIDFESQQYEFRLNNQAGVYNIDIVNFDGFLNNTNLNSLYFINQQKPQTYSGGQYINAGFVNGMWNFNSKFSVLLGLRAEMIAIEIDYLTLQSSNEERIAFIKEKLLPSLSAKYILKENMNFKFAASKTYTLPQFKERVNMLYEEVTQVYRGNNYVYESTNWNADLKWEYFPNDDELISATVFGKLIQNPINSIFINSTSNDISYINTGKQAEVYGLELELKKNLLRFNADDDEFDHKISGGLNISLLQTVQDLDTQKVMDETDYSANFTFDSSKLTGASDFLLNADVSYVKEFDTDKSIQGTVAYSYFSDQLNTIGTLNKGNVIDKSYGTLDFVVKSTMKQFSFGLSAKNLLNPTISRIQEVYNTPGTQEVVLDAFKKGVHLSLSIGYKF
ncbi:carboxypeptidase-like regulatory domain-containing protein [Flavobacteriaceae bacterium]|nr:carboxypeptidase-like regulatory domain-containing protein [Flavobacteriaceae bacterium]